MNPSIRQFCKYLVDGAVAILAPTSKHGKLLRRLSTIPKSARNPNASVQLILSEWDEFSELLLRQ